MSVKEEIEELLENIDRKLLLIEGERKAAKRKILIDGIIYSEIKNLKAILKQLNWEDLL